MLASRTDRIIFVSGKGGVGKSTVAAALALHQASLGRKVLLVELGTARYHADLFGIPEERLVASGIEPYTVAAGLSWARFDVEECLKQYVTHYVPSKQLYHLFFESRVMRSFIRASPALTELAILGKITSRERGVGPALPYDLLVVDGYSTGHMLALLRAPQEVNRVVPLGPMGKETASMSRVVQDPSKTRFVLVTKLEEMPVIETQEFVEKLVTEFHQECSIVCNQVWSLNFARGSGISVGAEQTDRTPLEFKEVMTQILEKERECLRRLQEIKKNLFLFPVIDDAETPQKILQECQPRMETPWTGF